MDVRLPKSLLDSEVQSLPVVARWLWISLLLLADRNGVVCPRESMISHRAQLTPEECAQSLAALEMAGLLTREPEQGWLITEYWRYIGSDDYGPTWSKQRQLARQRDGGKCRTCGSTDRVQVHHIRPLRSFCGNTLAANDLENLITLCHAHHRQAHGFETSEVAS